MTQGGGEGEEGKGGMPCTLCPHPTCKHSMIKQGVSSCPECDGGTLVLDPVSGPKWRVDCNRCSFLIYLPEQLHNAKLSKEHCEVGFRFGFGFIFWVNYLGLGLG